MYRVQGPYIWAASQGYFRSSLRIFWTPLLGLLVWAIGLSWYWIASLSSGALLNDRRINRGRAAGMCGTCTAGLKHTGSSQPELLTSSTGIGSRRNFTMDLMCMAGRTCPWFWSRVCTDYKGLPSIICLYSKIAEHTCWMNIGCWIRQMQRWSLLAFFWGHGHQHHRIWVKGMLISSV